MSRSYNRWKELIQEFFEEEPEAEVSITKLIQDITDNEFIQYTDEWYKIHNSVCRAIRKLEKEGFLETRFFPFYGVRDLLEEKNFFPSRIKMVRRKMGIHRIGIEWEIEQKEYNIFEIM